MQLTGIEKKMDLHRFWEQNVKQFWLPEEISVSKDIKVWNELSDKEKNYIKKYWVV